MNLAYIRVSAVDQNEQRQVDAMAKYEIQKTFLDKFSGKSKDRPGLKELLSNIRKGDKVYVLNIKRLGRSLRDLLSISDEIQGKGAELVFLEDNIDTSTIAGRMFFQIMGAVSEADAAWITERAAQGRASARARGRMGGRPKGLPDAKVKMAKTLHKNQEYSIPEICNQLSISKATFYRYLNA